MVKPSSLPFAGSNSGNNTNKKTLAKKNTMAFGNHHNNKQSKALTSFSPIKEIDY